MCELKAVCCARCSVAGVLGVVSGIIGCLQALEAIKLASGVRRLAYTPLVMQVRACAARMNEKSRLRSVLRRRRAGLRARYHRLPAGAGSHQASLCGAPACLLIMRS